MRRRRESDEQTAAKVALVVVGPRLGVSQACRLLGFSRDTYYRLARTYRDGGFGELVMSDDDRRERASRITREVEEAILALARREPHLGKTKVAARLEALGLVVSPSGVASVWKRHQLALAEQRVEFCRQNPVGEERSAVLETVLSEQRHLSAEFARVCSLLGREPRKAPSRPRQAAPGNDSYRAQAPHAPGDILGRLFGASTPIGCEPATSSPPQASNNRTASMLTNLFGIPARQLPAMKDVVTNDARGEDPHL